MKTAVVFRHVPFEDLDSLGETLLAKGYRWRYIDTPCNPSQHLIRWPTMCLSFWAG
jgi:GMP synthase (glutamine-hydrolysing)